MAWQKQEDLNHTLQHNITTSEISTTQHNVNHKKKLLFNDIIWNKYCFHKASDAPSTFTVGEVQGKQRCHMTLTIRPVLSSCFILKFISCLPVFSLL